MNARPSWPESRRLEALTILVLLLMTLGVAFLWQDIGFYDETIYLAQAASVTPEWLVNGLEKAPLYAVWYKMLGWLCPDPVHLYFLSWGVFVCLLLMLPFLFRLPGAWLCALALVCIPVFRVWPYVSLPVAVILLAGLLLVLQRRLSVAMATALAWVVCFIAAYVRSEYVYGVFSAFAAFTVVCWIYRGQAGHVWRIPLLLMLLGGSVWISHVQQMSDTGRSGIAFAQHFNLRAVERGELAGISPWTSDHALRAFNLDAGHHAANTTASVTDFLKADPGRFISHLQHNLVDFRTLLLIATILLFVLWPWWFARHSVLRPASLYVGLVSLPTLAATLLIYPRLHYAVSILPVLVVLAIALLRPQRWFRLAHAPWLMMLVLPILLVIAVGPRTVLSGSLQKDRPGLATVSCLRWLEQSRGAGKLLMLDGLGSPHAYLAKNWHVVPDYSLPDRAALVTWLQKERPDWVVSEPQQATRFQLTSAALTTLMVNQGYHVHDCPAPSVARVYVRR